MNLSTHKRHNIYKKCGKRCAYCGNPIKFEEMTVDHVIPRCLGGDNTMDNLLPSCSDCNGLKSYKSVEDFRSTIHVLTRKAIAASKWLIRYNVIKEVKPWDGKFYFEKLKEIQNSN